MQAVRQMGIRPVRITPLPDARHIFTHVEWHMRGYLVLSEELEKLNGGYTAIGPAQARETYSIPAAFAAYTGYMEPYGREF